MKSYLLILVFFLSICCGLSAQDKPVALLDQKQVIAELEHDFKAFQKKLTQIYITPTSKHVLAEEYSDLIDRIDAQFHTPKNWNKVKTIANTKTKYLEN
jgi:iron-sulfur cluster repair protein YtfE (RIC family)